MILSVITCVKLCRHVALHPVETEQIISSTIQKKPFDRLILPVPNNVAKSLLKAFGIYSKQNQPI